MILAVYLSSDELCLSGDDRHAPRSRLLPRRTIFVFVTQSIKFVENELS